jgi:hypothetical protein
MHHNGAICILAQVLFGSVGRWVCGNDRGWERRDKRLYESCRLRPVLVRLVFLDYEKISRTSATRSDSAGRISSRNHQGLQPPANDNGQHPPTMHRLQSCRVETERPHSPPKNQREQKQIRPCLACSRSSSLAGANVPPPACSNFALSSSIVPVIVEALACSASQTVLFVTSGVYVR